jgi:hypothetical protein
MSSIRRPIYAIYAIHDNIALWLSLDCACANKSKRQVTDGYSQNILHTYWPYHIGVARILVWGHFRLGAHFLVNLKSDDLSNAEFYPLCCHAIQPPLKTHYNIFTVRGLGAHTPAPPGYAYAPSSSPFIIVIMRRFEITVTSVRQLHCIYNESFVVFGQTELYLQK